MSASPPKFQAIDEDGNVIQPGIFAPDVARCSNCGEKLRIVKRELLAGDTTYYYRHEQSSACYWHGAYNFADARER